MTPDDSKVEKKVDIQEHCVQFYKELLGENYRALSIAEGDMIDSFTPFKCSDDLKSLLQAPVTADEVKS